MVDQLRFIALARSAARQAGAIGLHLQGKVEVERKESGGVPEAEAVTAVDRAAQEVILDRFHEAMPELAVDAEEDTAAVALFPPEAKGRALLVVDPIDGTLAYTRGSQDWAVMLGLIEDGYFTAALIDFPPRALTCWAVRGGGAFVAHGRGEGTRIERMPPAPDTLLVAPRMPPARLPLAHRIGLEPRYSRCSAVDSTAPATGRARAAIASDRADRRRALGLLITIEAGGAARFGDHVWRGEDPAGLPPEAAPTIAADSEALADAIARAFG